MLQNVLISARNFQLQILNVQLLKNYTDTTW